MLLRLSALILLYVEGMESIAPNLLGSVERTLEQMQEHLSLLWMCQKLRVWVRNIFPGLDAECEA